MDFGDSQAETVFGIGYARGWRDNNPRLRRRRPPTSTGRDRRRGIRALFDAGFFGMSWPNDIGGQGLPTVYEVIVDEELSAAGAPPRPSLGYLVQGILEHGNDDITGAGSCQGSSTAASAGARGSANRMPDPTSRRCEHERMRTATTTSSPGTRCGRATPTWRTGASCWRGPTPTPPSTKDCPPSRCDESTRDRAAPAADDQRGDKRVRRGDLRRRSRTRGQHDRRNPVKVGGLR